MNLVNEQDAVAGALDFLDDLLEPFLELAPVLGAGDQGTHVEGHQALVLEGVGNVALGNHLGHGFDDGGLAHARLAHQHRVVLGAAAENLDDPLQLLVAPMHRVQLLRPGGLGQVNAQVVQRGGLGVGAARLLALPGGVGQDAVGLGAHLVEGDAQTLQHAGGHALAFAQQADEQMLGADVGVVHAAGFVHRQLDHLLGAGSEADFALGRLLAAPDDELDSGTHLREVDGEAGQHPGRHALRLADKAEEYVLSPDIVVVEALGLILGQRQNTSRSLRKLLESAAHNTAPEPFGEA